MADDERNILEAVTIVLGPEYDITQAQRGDRALELFRQESFDLVISDVRMPGLDGVDFFREVRKLKPEQKFVFISVPSLFYDDPETGRIVTEEADGFLGKPYRIAELIELVETVLAK